MNTSAHKYINSIIKGASITMFGNIVGSFLRYIHSIILAYILGPTLLGAFYLGQTIINIFGFITRMGLETGIQKFIPLYKSENKEDKLVNALYTSIIISLSATIIIVIVIIFTKNILSEIFNEPLLNKIIIYLCLALVPLNLMLILTSYFRANKKMKYVVIIKNIIQPLTNMVLVVITYYLFQVRLSNALIAYFLSALLATLISVKILIKSTPSFSRVENNKFVFDSELIIYSLPLLMVAVLSYITNWIDTLMLGYFDASSSVGIYGIASRTATLTSFVLVGFNSVFAPTISELYANKDLITIEKLFKQITRWMFTVSLMIFLIILMFKEQLMGMFGNEFIIGSNALVWLAFGQFVNTAVGSVGFILMMSNRQKLMLINTIFIALLNTILNAVLIPKYSIDGASIATGVSTAVYNLLMLVQVYWIFKISPYNKEYIKPVVAGLISFFIGNQLIHFNLPLIINFILSGSSFLILYSGLILLFGISEEDKLIVNRLSAKFKS